MKSQSVAPQKDKSDLGNIWVKLPTSAVGSDLAQTLRQLAEDVALVKHLSLEAMLVVLENSRAHCAGQLAVRHVLFNFL